MLEKIKSVLIGIANVIGGIVILAASQFVFVVVFFIALILIAFCGVIVEKYGMIIVVIETIAIIVLFASNRELKRINEKLVKEKEQARYAIDFTDFTQFKN